MEDALIIPSCFLQKLDEKNNIKIWSIKQHHAKADLKDDTKSINCYVIFRKRITTLPVSPNEYGQHPADKLEMQLLFPPNRHQASVQCQHYSNYPSQEPFGEAGILISNQLTKYIECRSSPCNVLFKYAKNHGAYIFVAVI